MKTMFSSASSLRLRFMAIFVSLCLLYFLTWFSSPLNKTITPTGKFDERQKLAQKEVLIGVKEEDNQLPFCQSADRLLLFKDKGKSGFQHKIDDFLDGADLAVKYDRAIVDFSPALRADYMRNKYKETAIPNATYHMRYYHGWSWKNLLDTSRILYQITYTNGTRQRCKLRVVRKDDFLQLVHNSDHKLSIVSVEYGKKYPENPVHTLYRIKFLKQQTFALFPRKDVSYSGKVIFRRPFTKFITSSAQYVKERCFQLAEEKNKLSNHSADTPNRFVVIHIRSKNLTCALDRFTPNELVLKLEKIGVKRTKDVVYLMTDLEPNDAHFLALKSYFEGYYLFQASDINLYDHSMFAKKAALLIYATEIQLQEIADGIVETFIYRHQMPNTAKIIGHLHNSAGCV
ncbi:uncharacterized protein LOC142346085 isoform X2 [Convolutriloba macropyga]|uniref:uncharacterized protein LOC142346085 isoform X2 n=1 Tax=Convolutriloba macropyga TaxID=536237 RepID=UPI003F526FCE